MPGLCAGFPFIRSQPFLRHQCHGQDRAGCRSERRMHPAPAYTLRAMRLRNAGTCPPLPMIVTATSSLIGFATNRIRRTMTAVQSSLRFMGAGQSAKVRAFTRKTWEMFVLLHGKLSPRSDSLAGQVDEHRVCVRAITRKTSCQPADGLRVRAVFKDFGLSFWSKADRRVQPRPTTASRRNFRFDHVESIFG